MTTAGCSFHFFFSKNSRERPQRMPCHSAHSKDNPLRPGTTYVPGSKLLVLGMVIPPLIGILIYNGYINPYYWVDDHPLLYGSNGSLDPGT